MTSFTNHYSYKHRTSTLAFNLGIVLFTLTIAIAPISKAQERGKPATTEQFKSMCSSSFKAKMGCTLASMTIWAGAITGDALSQSKIGNMYRRGYYQGDKQFTKYFLGIMYANGEAVKKDVSKALLLLTQASKDGYYEVNFTLAALYSEGDGVETNPIKAYILRQSRLTKKLKDKSMSQLVFP